jgi:hypothetical protein
LDKIIVVICMGLDCCHDTRVEDELVSLGDFVSDGTVVCIIDSLLSLGLIFHDPEEEVSPGEL